MFDILLQFVVVPLVIRKVTSAYPGTKGITLAAAFLAVLAGTSLYQERLDSGPSYYQVQPSAVAALAGHTLVAACARPWITLITLCATAAGCDACRHRRRPAPRVS